MNKFLLIFLFLISACGQDYNSNSFDETRFGSGNIDTSSPAGQRLAAAFNIIQTNCISCHSNYHSFYGTYTTDELWLNSGLVVAGDFEGSFLIQNLKNYGGSMPQGGSQLSSEQIEVLREWIEAL